MNNKYILDEQGNPVPEPDLLKWGRWLETTKRHIAKDQVGGVQISTVFLGIDHSFGSRPPIFWETMIFGGPHDQYQERYSTRKEAEAGHQKALNLVRDSLKDQEK